MAIRDIFTRANSSTVGIASPFSDSSTALKSVLYTDLFGSDFPVMPLTRGEARSVPGVMAAENLLHATVGSLPLRAFKNGEPLATQPAWLTRTFDVFQNSFDRTCRMVSDLFYVGRSLLFITQRGADGYPLDVVHVDATSWRVENGVVFINDRPVNQADCVFIQGSFPGLLNVAQRTIRAAVDIENNVAARARVANPVLILQETQDSNLTAEERKDAVDSWVKNRQSPNGAVAFVPAGIEVNNLDDAGYRGFLLEARNAVISDIAKFTGIPSALLEGTSSIDSLTYTTERGQRSRLIDFSLRLWMDPVNARLSDGDITPLGTSVAFDLSELLNPPSRDGLNDSQPIAPEVTA